MKRILFFNQTIPVLIVSQFVLLSCANYYKAITPALITNTEKASKIDSLKNAHRIFVLRNGNAAFSVTDPVIDVSQNNLQCFVDTLSRYHQLHLRHGRNGNMRYKKNFPAERSVLEEVHLYISPDSSLSKGNQAISLDNIYKIEVIEKNKQKSADSHVLGGIGIILGMGLAAIAIFIATFHPVE